MENHINLPKSPFFQTSTPRDTRRNFGPYHEVNLNMVANVEFEDSTENFGNFTRIDTEKYTKLAHLYKRKKQEVKNLTSENETLREIYEKNYQEICEKITILDRAQKRDRNRTRLCLLLLFFAIFSVFYLFKIYFETNLPQNGSPFV